MTGRTRDYLADLALKKGVTFPNEQEREQAWASVRIDELKNMPDANFEEFTEADAERVQKQIDKVIEGMESWTFLE